MLEWIAVHDRRMAGLIFVVSLASAWGCSRKGTEVPVTIQTQEVSPVDNAKCIALKLDLAAQPAPQVVAIDRFFDGNDDPASIGCNLDEHPGIDRFAQIITRLVERPDVEAVYAQIAEVDPGDDMWPFTDTILVVGVISTDDLHSLLTSLQPTDVWEVNSAESPLAQEWPDTPVHAVVWD
jgi:hypothetical protein